MYDVHGHRQLRHRPDDRLHALGRRRGAGGDDRSSRRTTGEPALTVDTPVHAPGNDPTTPSSCTSITGAPNHLLNILENGNTNNNYGGNDETGLDVEISHGMAPGVAEKYYLADCSTTPSPGLTNGGSCNGSDVGLEEAIEDAANDSTLHSVSDSWGYGGDPEYGSRGPVQRDASATASRSPRPPAPPSTSRRVTPAPTRRASPPTAPTSSRSAAPRRSRRRHVTGSSTGDAQHRGHLGRRRQLVLQRRGATRMAERAGVTANALVPGAGHPGHLGGRRHQHRGLRGVQHRCQLLTAPARWAARASPRPIMNGMEADTENYVAAQTYPSATPAIGFEGPIMYELGNSANYTSYYRDVLCGNDADPTCEPRRRGRAAWLGRGDGLGCDRLAALQHRLRDRSSAPRA